MISNLLYNTPKRTPYFFENFFCYEDSDIDSFFSDFTKNNNFIQTQYGFIIHPECLSSHNQTIFKEKIISIMIPIHDMDLQKFVIITSSSDFVFGKEPDGFKNGEIFGIEEVTMKVDVNILREFTPIAQQLLFLPQIRQSKEAGYGKSKLINQEIENIINNTDSKNYTFHVYHHFIADGNQRFPIESFNGPEKIKNIIHFQFNDEIMQQGIKFWSYLFQLFTEGFVLPTKGEPMSFEGTSKNLVFFEIPQLRKKGKPLISLSEFPLPISSEFHINKDSLFGRIYKYPIKIETMKEIEFKSDKDVTKYYLFGINLVVNKLKENKIDNLRDYIKIMRKI